MAITFNLELNSKATKNKTYVILLRITQDKKHIRKKTTVEVKSKTDFNSKAKQGKWIRPSEPNHKVWNDALEKEIEEAKNTYRDLRTSGLATKELIKSRIISADVSPSFLEFVKQRAKDIYAEGGYRNYKKYNGFINKLENYLVGIRKKDLLFSELTTSFVAKFETHLHTLHNKRQPDLKLHASTVSLTIRILKTLVNRAIAEKIIKPEMNPFLGFKYTSAIASPKEKLNESEIKAIEDLELPEGTLIWHCRNYFLFSYYMAGIRAGDVMQLRWCNVTSEGRLEYRMGKTNKDRNIKLHSKAMAILLYYRKPENKPTDYIFPLLDNNSPYAKASTEEQKSTLSTVLIVKLSDAISSKNALINKYLKKIALKVNITKHVSFHISRHSFAKIAKDKHVDNNHLKNLLGHSNIKITEVYMGNFETQETDAVMNSIFDEVPDAMEIVKKQLASLDPDALEQLFSEIRNVKSENNK